VETATCECGNSDETGMQYPLWCTMLDGEREKLRKEVGICGIKVEKLLEHLKFIIPVERGVGYRRSKCAVVVCRIA